MMKKIFTLFFGLVMVFLVSSAARAQTMTGTVDKSKEMTMTGASKTKHATQNGYHSGKHKSKKGYHKGKKWTYINHSNWRNYFTKYIEIRIGIKGNKLHKTRLRKASEPRPEDPDQ